MPMGALAGHLRSFHEIGSVVEHLGDIATAPAEQPAPRPPAPPLRGELATEKLGFRHTRGGAWVVRDVDMQIPAGGKLAVVGSSGSGKSTLVKLLAGLYPAAEGTVSFDGRDLRSLDLASLRRRLGVVLQDPFLLAGTVAENIALRRPDAPLADVIAAAELAAVHDDIAGLPLGYATTLANGGAELSGGQCQRIALARSLLDRPSVLLLDEATSHLDSATEAQIERNLQGLEHHSDRGRASPFDRSRRGPDSRPRGRARRRVRDPRRARGRGRTLRGDGRQSGHGRHLIPQLLPIRTDTTSGT